MCSELTPRARIPDTRIPQLMQPCCAICSTISLLINNQLIIFMSPLVALFPPIPSGCICGCHKAVEEMMSKWTSTSSLQKNCFYHYHLLPLIIPLPHLRLQPPLLILPLPPWYYQYHLVTTTTSLLLPLPPLRLPLPPAARMMGRPGWEVVCGEGEAGQRLLHRPVSNVFMKISWLCFETGDP